MANQESVIIEFEGGSRLKCFENGDVFRWYPASKVWKEISNVANSGGCYNYIGVEKQKILRHRLICFAFKDFDFVNSDLQIDHVDRNKLNNSIDNLRVVTNQQNSFNRSNTKGFTWDKKAKKFQAKIQLNGKTKFLGRFNDEADARQAYLKAKQIYHII